ncbi:hypothetical protein LEP1GSC086_1021 [Leptospira weilii str. LNT 1234]|nr:hypothetical protein LEP1GSC086_1021 [Leptospira weilii str. LNT 1234]
MNADKGMKIFPELHFKFDSRSRVRDDHEGGMKWNLVCGKLFLLSTNSDLFLYPSATWRNRNKIAEEF